MKTVCIYHSIDLDGWMSAAIVKHWFLNDRDGIDSKYRIILKEGENHVSKTINGQNYYLDFIGYNYGQPIPDLSEYDKVIMCDISFPEKELFDLFERFGSDLIYIDHHISALNMISNSNRWNSYSWTEHMFKGLQDTKFAACELTWKYFFGSTWNGIEENPMPEIVRLLGRYDCFGSRGTDEEQKVLEFQYGARQCITNYEDAYNYLIECKDDSPFSSISTKTHQIHVKGSVIYQYLCTEAKQTYKNGFEIRLPLLSPNYTKTYKEKKKKKLIEVSNDKSSCTLYIYNDDITSGYIANVFVNEEHRRKGIGTALMLEVEKIAKKEGIKGLYVKVLPNSNTYRFYHSLGYKIFDEKNDEKWFTKGIGIDSSYKFLCINKERFNPINFGIDYHSDGYDGVACFWYANGMWNFSLYNDNGEVDCSIIAKQYGGGGHKGAAGFKIKNINDIIK